MDISVFYSGGYFSDTIRGTSEGFYLPRVVSPTRGPASLPEVSPLVTPLDYDVERRRLLLTHLLPGSHVG